jgi:hypothetical protein
MVVVVVVVVVVVARVLMVLVAREAVVSRNLAFLYFAHPFLFIFLSSLPYISPLSLQFPPNHTLSPVS